MISHALTIVANEMRSHLASAYGMNTPAVTIGNIAEGVGTTGGAVSRDVLNLTVINLQEEKTLKNVPNYVRNDARLTVTYENAPAFLNLLVLVVATHIAYGDALLMLSRAIRFFQSTNVFTHDTVLPASLTTNAPNTLDQLEAFKLIFDLHSPPMEEVNHMWGTLGGKQYPFVVYRMRMLDLKYRVVQGESGLITEVISEFRHKNAVAL